MADQRYSQRGVSASKEDVHAAIARLDKGLFPNAFCKILPDMMGHDAEWCTLIHADGAGTKSSLAYTYWKETGDLSVWAGIAQDAIVMNLDDLLCVGATQDFLLSSTIGRNKHQVPGEVIKALIEGSQAFCDRMAEWGIRIHFGGGETADVGDLVRTVIVDSTMAVRMRRREVISNDRIQAGDVVVGLASFGQARYEDTYNGGMGSNGLTSARHDVFHHDLASRYPESFDPETKKSLVYCGPHALTDKIQIPHYGEMTIGQLVLSPTRTYAPVLVPVLEAWGDRIHGLVHCSGGAQTKVKGFISKLRVVKDNLFPTQPLFEVIHQASGTSWEEMYKVFNMGHRMEIYTDATTAELVMAEAESMGVEARIVGYVEEAPRAEVLLKTPYGEFKYV